MKMGRNHFRYRHAASDRLSEIEVRGAIQPAAELHEERVVQMVLFAYRFEQLPADLARAHEDSRGVAGSDIEQREYDKREYRNRYDEFRDSLCYKFQRRFCRFPILS